MESHDAPTIRDVYPSRCTVAPQIMPRHDPVVYSSWNTSAPIDQDQADFYARNGFLVLHNLLSPAEIDILQRHARSLLANPEPLEPETLVTEPGSGLTRSIFMVHAQDEIFSRLTCDARIADIATFLLGDSVYVHQSRLNYKAGLRGKEFYWHSDFETWHVEDGMVRMRALSVSVLLSDNRATNGPLMVIPKSQKSFISCTGETPEDHYKSSLRKQDYGTPDDDVLAQLAHENGIVPILGNAGTIVIFDCNMMHGSNGNITPWPRSNLFVVYNALSNRLADPFGAKKPRPEFIATRKNVRAITPVRGRLTA